MLIKKGSTGTFNYNVIWKDSTGATGSATGITGDYTIDGVAPGLVTVAITGSFPHLKNSSTRNGIVDVKQWGANKWANMSYMFAGESYLTGFSAPDTPDTSLVTNMSYMFSNAQSFDQDLSLWCVLKIASKPSGFDTSNVTNMGNMFQLASVFNQDLSGWCVSKIATKPSDFDTSTTAWMKTGRQPVWGTCPAE